MEWAVFLIAGLCLFLYVARRPIMPGAVPLVRLNSHHLSVDGNSVVGGPFGEGLRPYVLITALFHHAASSHVINNTLMLLATGRELERRIGGLAFLLLFCLTGAFGWLCTLANYYITMPEAWKDGIAQMQTSVGSSPATYGMATMAAITLPVDDPVGGGLFCTTWASAMLLLWAPKFFDDKYGLNLAQLPSNWVRVGSVGVACAVASCTVLPPLASWAGPGASQFFFFYLFVCCVPFTLVDWLSSGKSSATDHGMHDDHLTPC
mmetsp:Transcript_106998/g.310708  ORF Transcript_106998/g.310708 Transcript_106998/m.310708 type:complete len:263 (-) Transcript_106998:1058-1846(-)